MNLINQNAKASAILHAKDASDPININALHAMPLELLILLLVKYFYLMKVKITIFHY